MQPDVIVAYEKDFAPLPEGLRLVVPEANGNIWISMITSINMSTLQPPSDGQSGNTGKTAVEQIQSSANITEQPSTQQQTQVQPQPIAPKNETIIEQVAPPANVTQPEQRASQQDSGSQGLGFPAEVVYGIVIAAAVTAVAVGFVVYRCKNTRISP